MVDTTFRLSVSEVGGSIMMTLAHGLLALSCYFLWRRGADWSWMVALLALVVGTIIFVHDVDFSTNLGIRL